MISIDSNIWGILLCGRVMKQTIRRTKLNTTSLEEWMKEGKAPALEHSLKLFNDLKGLGVQIILVSSRRECLRSATIDNLVDVGYHGWASLILRFEQSIKHLFSLWIHETGTFLKSNSQILFYIVYYSSTQLSLLSMFSCNAGEKIMRQRIPNNTRLMWGSNWSAPDTVFGGF